MEPYATILPIPTRESLFESGKKIYSFGIHIIHRMFREVTKSGISVLFRFVSMIWKSPYPCVTQPDVWPGHIMMPAWCSLDISQYIAALASDTSQGYTLRSKTENKNDSAGLVWQGRAHQLQRGFKRSYIPVHKI